MINIKFKTDRIQREFESGEISLKLIIIIKWLMQYISIAYPDYENLTLTDLKRTQAEQDKIYLNSNDPEIVKRYKLNPWLSVHQFNRGADIRTDGMTAEMIKNIIKVLNSIPYDTKRPAKKTAIYHDLGTGAHIHIQTIK